MENPVLFRFLHQRSRRGILPKTPPERVFDHGKFLVSGLDQGAEFLIKGA